MASISERLDKDGNVISYRIRVSRGRGLKPYETTWPERGEIIPATWSRRTVQKAVQQFAAEFELRCKRGEVSDCRLTFEQYAKQVIELKEANGLKHSTALRYRELLGRYCDENVNGFGCVKVTDLRPDMLNAFYLALSKPGASKRGGKLAPKTILEYHRFAHSVLAQAVKEAIVPYNVADRATPPRPPKTEADYLQPSEIEAVFTALEKETLRWRVLVHFLLATGVRRGEALGLKWRQVNFETGQAHLCENLLYTPEHGCYTTTLKTGESRSVTLPQTLLDLLRTWRRAQTLQRLKMGSMSKTRALKNSNLSKIISPQDSLSPFFHSITPLTRHRNGGLWSFL